RSAETPAPCTPSSAEERKLSVSSTSDAVTSAPTTTRRLTALERVEAGPEVAERWTGEPRTATRAVRLRGTSAVSLAAPAGGYLLRPLRRERARARALFRIASNSSRLRPDPTATHVS